MSYRVVRARRTAGLRGVVVRFAGLLRPFAAPAFVVSFEATRFTVRFAFATPVVALREALPAALVRTLLRFAVPVFGVAARLRVAVFALAFVATRFAAGRRAVVRAAVLVVRRVAERLATI